MIAANLFYFFATLTVIFSAMVVMLRNPITAALSLVGSLFCVSALFVLLNAAFLGVIQVLIYVGAVLVLFLYVFMLLDLRGTGDVGTFGRVIRSLVLAPVPFVLALLLPRLHLPSEGVIQVPTSFGSVASVGKALLGPYALIFELLSIVLLAAIIGAVALGGRKKGGVS
jgi:NADH-quinone oxidoreductase subunit J